MLVSGLVFLANTVMLTFPGDWCQSTLTLEAFVGAGAAEGFSVKDGGDADEEGEEARGEEEEVEEEDELSVLALLAAKKRKSTHASCNP